MTELLTLSSAEWVARANALRTSLHCSPEQSHFRVTALLLVQCGESAPIVVEGTNAEQGYIGGAICAERSALCKLRFLKHPKILKVVVATDSSVPISPGALCREYLSSHAVSTTPVVVGNQDGSVVVDCTLNDLQPFPYLYRYCNRKNVENFSIAFAESMTKCEILGNAQITELHALAMTAIQLSTIHPITFAAAVMFQDGTTEVARFLPGNEYGCSLDPVSQLVRDMDRKLRSAKSVDKMELAKPEWIVQIDQYGVCHAPFAMARSLLTENNLAATARFVYHTTSGSCEVGLVDSLVPLLPHLDKLTHDHFMTFDSTFSERDGADCCA